MLYCNIIKYRDFYSNVDFRHFLWDIVKLCLLLVFPLIRRLFSASFIKSPFKQLIKAFYTFLAYVLALTDHWELTVHRLAILTFAL